MSPSESGARRVRAIVLFHGWGGTGAELERTLGTWTRRWPGIKLIALEAPNLQDGASNGRQWFSRIGIDAGNRASRVTGAREGVDSALRAALAGTDLEVADTAWLGFSQGAMVVLDAITQGRFAPSAAIAIAGRLVLEPGLPVATDILLLHGERDDVVPASNAHAAHEVLHRNGYRSELALFPQVGHQLTRDVIERAARFLDPKVANTTRSADQ